MALPMNQIFTDNLLPQTEEDVWKVVQVLSDGSVCPRCMLRVLGHKDQDDYKLEQKEIYHILKRLCGKEDEADNNNVDQPCALCLGLLQSFCNEAFVDKIVGTIKSKGVEFNSYFCAISMPVQLIVREHSILIKLKEVLRSVYFGLKDESIVNLKDVWKWINGPGLGDRLGKPFEQGSPFEVSLAFVHPEVEKECNFLMSLYPDTYRKRKNKTGWEIYTRMNVLKSLNETSDNLFQKYSPCPPKKLTMMCTCEGISCSHGAIFLAGRYNKYSRELSQSPWVLDGKKLKENSVEELICDRLKEIIKPQEIRFSSSGREDVDVRMLGRGRPFALEILNPKRVNFSQADLTQLQQEINSSTKDIAIRDFQEVTRESLYRMKEGEAEKVKYYTALCWCSNPVTQKQLDALADMKDLVLSQKTPIRVLHRRNLSTRDKVVHSMSAELIDEQYFKLKLQTQAGTYIKEFVHGDFARTQPNLGTLLGADCDILELDVEDVELDWPPSLECK